MGCRRTRRFRREISSRPPSGRCSGPWPSRSRASSTSGTGGSAMSSTFFTASPQWRWLIVAYFFLGGLAAGSYFLATLMDLFGDRRDRRLVHLGYLVAFPLVGLCGLVLTVDLGRPERFWHMLIQSETLRPMIKTYSPMSLGAWALLCFGGCALLSFVAVLAERGWLRWPLLRPLSPPAFVGRLLTGGRAPLRFFVGGLTGAVPSLPHPPLLGGPTPSRVPLPRPGAG